MSLLTTYLLIMLILFSDISIEINKRTYQKKSHKWGNYALALIITAIFITYKVWL